MTQKGFYIPYITKMRKVKLRKKYSEKEIKLPRCLLNASRSLFAVSGSSEVACAFFWAGNSSPVDSHFLRVSVVVHKMLAACPIVTSLLYKSILI